MRFSRHSRIKPLLRAYSRRFGGRILGSAITSYARLLPYRELNDAVALADMGGDVLADPRTGKKVAIGWLAYCVSQSSDGSPAMRT